MRDRIRVLTLSTLFAFILDLSQGSTTIFTFESFWLSDFLSIHKSDTLAAAMRLLTVYLVLC